MHNRDTNIYRQITTDKMQPVGTKLSTDQHKKAAKMSTEKKFLLQFYRVASDSVKLAKNRKKKSQNINRKNYFFAILPSDSQKSEEKK